MVSAASSEVDVSEVYVGEIDEAGIEDVPCYNPSHVLGIRFAYLSDLWVLKLGLRGSSWHACKARASTSKAPKAAFGERVRRDLEVATWH